MKRVLHFLKPYRAGCIIGPFFKLLEAIFELIVPLVMAKIIDIGIRDHDKSYILKMCLVLGVLALCGLTFAVICQYLSAQTAFRFGRDFRAAFHKHISRFTHAELDRIGTAKLATCLTNDITQMQTGVNMFLRLAMRSPFLVAGALVMAFSIDLKLSLIFLPVTILIALLLTYIMYGSVPVYQRLQAGLEQLYTRMRESLDGVRVIRAFARQKESEGKLRADADHLFDCGVAAGKFSALLNGGTFLILNLGIVAVLWTGGKQVDTGRLTVGELTAFVNYMNQILIALVALANLIVVFTKTAASISRVNAVMDTEPSFTEGERTLPDQTDAPLFDFQNVTFTYAGSDAPSLSDITVSLRAGETLGIIGTTGSGKSTFLHLLQRFYEADSGEISVLGNPISEYRYSALRGMIGVVPQQSVLFMGTVRDNLRRGNPDATDAEIWAALRTAQAEEFVQKMADGLDSVLAEGGKNLSGGQRQRLTIARALVRNPRLLLLDDSMSALDFATDAALRAALRTDLSDTAVVMVSQRATSLMHADRILVLDDGEQVGLGTHEELLKSCEEYLAIYHLGQMDGGKENV